MNNKKTVFLTGATGLVGSYLLKVLLQNGYKIYALARSKDNKTARDRITDILNFWDKNILAQKSHNLVVLDGDITQKNLGLDKKHIDLLKKEIEEIFHCAAVTNYRWTLEEIKKVNVLGTKRILNFAMQCNKERSFKKVNYVSSVYVCGNYNGTFRENNLDVGQKFNTAYEQSKFEAEQLIHTYRNRGLWVDIFRPPMIVGESSTGRIPVLQQHFYQILHIWSLGIFDYFPGKGSFANMVPVDELSESILAISSNTTIKNGNYHLFNSHRIFLENVLNIFKNLFRVEKPIVASVKQISKLYFTPIQRIILKNLFFTFNSRVKLDSNLTEKILRNYGFTFSKINKKLLFNIFEYLTKINFFNKGYLLQKDTKRKIR